MIKAEQIHCGQFKRYGDFFRIWEIETDEPKEAVKEYCFKELYNKSYDVPLSSEWHANININGAKSGDASYYFRGYYTLTKLSWTENEPLVKYEFKVCEPYAD